MAEPDSLDQLVNDLLRRGRITEYEAKAIIDRADDLIRAERERHPEEHNPCPE